MTTVTVDGEGATIFFVIEKLPQQSKQQADDDYYNDNQKYKRTKH